MPGGLTAGSRVWYTPASEGERMLMESKNESRRGTVLRTGYDRGGNLVVEFALDGNRNPRIERIGYVTRIGS